MRFCPTAGMTVAIAVVAALAVRASAVTRLVTVALVAVTMGRFTTIALLMTFAGHAFAPFG